MHGSQFQKAAATQGVQFCFSLERGGQFKKSNDPTRSPYWLLARAWWPTQAFHARSKEDHARSKGKLASLKPALEA